MTGSYHVFARFKCNAGGVRVGVFNTALGAQRFANRFARMNHVEVSCTWKPEQKALDFRSTKP